ncbi:predicted protein [Streptomyces sp. C]|nr:VOC family protein [Streptomyces sp. C]EFL12847.1 predicted protein [Streptomyces sp. C]
MLTNVMYVTLYVTDQDRALRFYTEQLGLQKRIDFPNPGGRFLTVGVPGSPVELLLWAHAPAAGQPAEPGATPGPVILESDDLRADFTLLRDRGVTFDEPEPVTMDSASASRRRTRTGTVSPCASAPAQAVTTPDRPWTGPVWQGTLAGPATPAGALRRSSRLPRGRSRSPQSNAAAACAAPARSAQFGRPGRGHAWVARHGPSPGSPWPGHRGS